MTPIRDLTVQQLLDLDSTVDEFPAGVLDTVLAVLVGHRVRCGGLVGEVCDPYYPPDDAPVIDLHIEDGTTTQITADLLIQTGEVDL